MITNPHDRQMPNPITVKNDGKVVGRIKRPARDQYHYEALNGHHGETFGTLEGVKASLEG